MTHLKATIDSSKKQEAPRKETDQKLKKQKGSNRSNKKISDKSNCICEGRITNSDMIRCNWCMDWYHDLCVGITKSDTVVFWVCPECRQLPKTVKRLEQQLMPYVSENEKLRKQLEENTKDRERLQAENSRLRKRISTTEVQNRLESVTRATTSNLVTVSETEEQNTPMTGEASVESNIKKASGSLLAGSSIIRDINNKNYQLDMKPLCVRGGKANDITNELLSLPKETKFENIMLLVGSNDCTSSSFNETTFQEDYTNLFQVAKLIAENIVLVSLCPRLDDASGNIRRGNIIIEKLANDENCHYVDNESSFRLLNGSINTALYNKDGIHLNYHGTRKLAHNLEIKPKVKHNNTQEDSNRNQRGNRKRELHTKPRAPESKHPLVGDTHDFDYDFNYLSKTTPVPKTGCFICGESNHNAYKCRHVSPVECHNCHEFGHKAKFCRAKK